MALRIIATGGAFDRQYDPIGGNLTFDGSHLPEILQTARLAEPADFEIVTLIDSLEMGDEQRYRILDAEPAGFVFNPPVFASVPEKS